MSPIPVRDILRRAYAFLAFLCLNPLLLYFWLHLPVPIGGWLFWAYHGLEIGLVLAVLASSAAREVKIRALCILLGILVGLGGEWWVLNDYSHAQFRARHSQTLSGNLVE